MKNKIARIFPLKESNDVSRVCKEVIHVFSNNGVIAFPTETVYGIGALRGMGEAIERIYTIKGRDKEKPCAIYIYDVDDLNRLNIVVPTWFNEFSDEFLPGPITFILKDQEGQSVGIRYSSLNPLNHLLAMLPDYVVGTSANKSGEDELLSADGVMSVLGKDIDLILDGGSCCELAASTVIDFTKQPYNIVRKGSEWKKIETFFFLNKLEIKK